MRKPPLLLLLLVLAAACRGGGPSLSETRPTPISAPASAEGGGSADVGGGVGGAIALRLWVQQDVAYEAAYQALADKYMAANPDVTIAIEAFAIATYGQTIQDSLLAGTAADLLQVPGGTLCVYSASLAPAPQPILDLNPQSVFNSVLLGGFVCDGALYGLPQEATIPWGLAASRTSAAADVAWDFIRFATLDPAVAAEWNAATSTAGAIGN